MAEKLPSPQASSSSASLDRRVLYGGWEQPWTDAFHLFRAVDDRIRGGSSTSNFVAVVRKEPLPPFADFWGELDTKTLGGAGFASQACTLRDPLDLQEYDGLELVILPSTPHDVDAPTRFNLNLKTDLGERRPDGRLESTVSYEYEFACTPPDDTPRRPYDTVTLRARWADFTPTYRGRPKPDAEPLHPERIREISLMCRSNFDKQSGKYSLYLMEIAAFSAKKQEHGPLSRLRIWWTALQNWFWSLLHFRNSGRGHVRL